MPHSIVIENGVVVGKYWGELATDEIREAKQEIAQMPGFHPDFPQIIDLTNASLKKLSFASVAALMREESIGSPLAVQVVVVPNDAAFNAGKMLQQMAPSTGRAILLARSYSEARTTLELLGRTGKL